ncbi:MAG: carbohydrate ABC transporter substrate-binding protein [Oscillospiraceae bacterium]|nr:carbohydrate ABC transporter substrate-binding protein [Oscillospiraceae bacterium]
MKIKKIIALSLAAAMTAAFAAGCTNDSGSGDTGGGGAAGGGGATGGGGAAASSTTINVWSFTDEIPNAFARYKELNPDFPYEINATVVSDQDGAYESALENALMGGGSAAPDIYTAEQAFVLKYTQGGFSQYASTYKDLGIEDLEGRISSAQLAQYAIDAGTRNGEVVGLRFQETGGTYIYRRSIANDIWGTDDPAVIAEKIGPGWDRFMEAAAELRAGGYSIVSGDEDVWQVARDGATQPWIVDNKLVIDPERLAFMDLAKQLHDNGYMNGSLAWNDPWYADMGGVGLRPVFGFLGPAWLINYVMINNVGDTFGDWAVTTSPVPFTWGGTWVMGNKDVSDAKKDGVRELIEWITLDTSETGFQQYFANGTLFDEPGAKDTVASKVVMERSDGSLDMLGGQNMFDYFIPAAANAHSAHWTEFDRAINNWFNDQTRQYYNGNKSKEQAIEDFKRQVADNLNFDID